MQGQRPLRGSQVPRLPAGLQVQGLPKREDKRKASNEQLQRGNSPPSLEGISLSFPTPERNRRQADPRACPLALLFPLSEGSDPTTHLNSDPSAYPPAYPSTHSSICVSLQPLIHLFILPFFYPSHPHTYSLTHPCIFHPPTHPSTHPPIHPPSGKTRSLSSQSLESSEDGQANR